MNYFFALFLIGIAILVHEFGHFIIAKLVKIPIKVFSIGFGPKLISRKIGSTTYKLSIVPLGGYVLPDIEDEKDYFQIPAGKRIAMSVGGPLASILLPLFCFMAINIISSGFSFRGIFIDPLTQLSDMVYNMVVSLSSVTSTKQLSGIIGIVGQGGAFIGSDILKGLSFLSLMSINFALINMIPIPVLDGGKILLYCLEKVHVKFLRLHYPLAIAGWVFVAGLMVYVSMLDIFKLVA